MTARMARPFPKGTRARLICEVALATQTAPSQWWEEDSATLATVLQLLEEQTKAVKKAGRQRRGK